MFCVLLNLDSCILQVSFFICVHVFMCMTMLVLIALKASCAAQQIFNQFFFSLFFQIHRCISFFSLICAQIHEKNMFGTFLVVKFTSQCLGFYKLNKYFSCFPSISNFEFVFILAHRLGIVQIINSRLRSNILSIIKMSNDFYIARNSIFNAKPSTEFPSLFKRFSIHGCKLRTIFTTNFCTQRCLKFFEPLKYFINSMLVPIPCKAFLALIM